MSQDRQRGVATALLNLPRYRGPDAVDDPVGGRWILIQQLDPVGHCPSWGSARAECNTVSRIAGRDVDALSVEARPASVVTAEGGVSWPPVRAWAAGGTNRGARPPSF